jgi:hypothetical protein
MPPAPAFASVDETVVETVANVAAEEAAPAQRVGRRKRTAFGIWLIGLAAACGAIAIGVSQLLAV